MDAIFDGRWSEILRPLRAILLAGPLTEEHKWRGPCYTHDGANVAMLGALRDCAVLSFFKGALLSDPAGILEPAGPNSRSARVLRLTDAAQIDADLLAAYVAEAIAKAHDRVDLSDDPVLPDEIAAHMEPALLAAFHALTPGRQRGWIVHLTGAKQPSTRLARLEKAALRILVGKGMHDR